MPIPPDPLDSLLNRWEEPDKNRPSLAPEVWRRIAQDEAAQRASGGLWAEIDGWLSRPPFAFLFVTCCALLGLFLAEVRLNHLQREQGALLAKSYLQLIDPLLKTDASVRTP